MINHEKGEATLTIGGSVYTLALKMAGLMALQKRLSPPGTIKKLELLIPELQEAIAAGSLEHVVVFMWAALQKYHPGMTEQDAVDLVDEAGGLLGLDEAFSALTTSMMPDRADVEELSVATKGGNPRGARAAKKIPGAGVRSTSAPAPLA